MMKLKMLVVAAGLAALPVIAGAQTPTDTTKKDTMVMTTPAPASTMATPATTATPATSALPAESVNGARPIPPSDGTTCPWGCPTSKGTAGLTGPQFLALQQEIRDKGCGAIRITGVLDAPTRRGISTCAKKLGVKNNAAAVLVAMNIGYSDADVSAAKMEE
jgi:hypothetical protein